MTRKLSLASLCRNWRSHRDKFSIGHNQKSEVCLYRSLQLSLLQPKGGPFLRKSFELLLSTLYIVFTTSVSISSEDEEESSTMAFKRKM